MPLAPAPTRARRPPRAKLGPAVLAAMMRGASLDEIARMKRMSRARVETSLRDELQRCWAPRADDYARFQVSWLERIAGKLVAKTMDGDLKAVDRLLRLSERLDRYRGFTKGAPGIVEDYAVIHARLMAKMNSALTRAPAPPREGS